MRAIHTRARPRSLLSLQVFFGLGFKGAPRRDRYRLGPHEAQVVQPGGV